MLTPALIANGFFMRKKPLDATVATTEIFYETFFLSFAPHILEGTF